MATAPTFTITAQDGFLQLVFSGGVGDYSQLWRSTPLEYGGLPIKIASALPLETFVYNDYAVASDRQYDYFAVAVDTGTAASATVSGSLHLPLAFIHSVHKEANLGNRVLSTDPDEFTILTEDGIAIIEETATYQNAADGQTLELIDQEPHRRLHHIDMVARVLTNRPGARLGISPIEQTDITLPIVVPMRDFEKLITLREIFRSRRYQCLRDSLGNKWFGRLLPPTEPYGYTRTDTTLQFQTLAFNEAVA